MSWLETLGYGALLVLVAGWLAVSFGTPGRLRTALETLSAAAIFVALLALFGHLAGRASETGNGVAVYAFGFLCALFGSGALVSLVQLAQQLRPGGKGQISATN